MLAIINDTGILVVLVAVVLLFGAARIPRLARNLGEASREFKRAQDEARGDATLEPKAIGASSERITMTRGELDALLTSSSTQARQPASGQTTS